MSANTPKGYPYPLGTDRVMDGDNAIQALATAVDKRAVLSGQVNVPQIAAGAAGGPIAVVFPAGYFTNPPNVVVTPSNGRLNMSAGSVTAAGFNIGVGNWTTAQASAGVAWWLAAATD